MKKLMMAAAIVCAAVASNASTVNWGLDESLGEKFASGNLYLFAGSSIADLTTWAASQTSFTLDSVKTALGADLAALNGAPNTITLAGGMGTSMGNDVKTFGDSKTGTYSVFVVAISEDGKNLAVANKPTALNIRNVSSPAQATYTGANMTPYSAAAVPEPTSGLLLLLGVAGMALRRRRA